MIAAIVDTLRVGRLVQHEAVAARVPLHRCLSPARQPRPDPELRRALPTTAASVPGLVSRVLVPNRFLSKCRPPSSPKTSPAPRSFHALAQRRHDRLPAEPTPLSTPSIAAPRRASEDK